MSGNGSRPAGGYKVVYEYANRLVKAGWNVTVVYPITLCYKKSSFLMKIRLIPRILKWLKIGYSARKWFKLDSRVKEKWVLSLNKRHVPESDIYFATAVQTAYYLKDYPISDKKKLYLIQDFENWEVSDDCVYNSYGLGLKNIVISKWLEQKVTESGNTCILIPNGFDFQYFKMSLTPEQKEPHSVAMLYHNDERKGCRYGIEAIKMLREDFPDLKVKFFGVPDKPSDLPDWVTYFQKPERKSHNKIYNESAIYLAPSVTEGWGLTVGESMICGCAVVCTDADGFKEMVINEENGLICDSHNSEALYNAMKRLLLDNDLRIKLAHNGNEAIKQFTWDSSMIRLSSILSKI